MLSLFGVDMGTPFQGATLAALITGLFVVLRVYVTGLPERARVRNEARQIESSDHVLLRSDLFGQIKVWREEVHELKNTIAVLEAKQLSATRALRNYEDDRRTMLFLIELLIAELDRIDPTSQIVKQAKMTLARLEGVEDQTKSRVRNAAEHSVEAAQDTLDRVSAAEEQP